MMNEEEALNSILGEMYGEEETPTEESQDVVEIPQEDTVPQNDLPLEEMPQEAELPQETPIAPQDANKELIARLVQMQEQTSQQNQMLMEKLSQKEEVVKQLSEEDLAIQNLKEQLGLDKVEQENQILRQQLEQIAAANDKRAEQEQMMQQQAQLQEAIRIEANKFTKEFPDIQPEKVMDFIRTQPAQLQAQYDTPQGWRLIAHVLKQQATTTQIPDAITSTQSTPTVRSASQERRQGKEVSDMAIVEELLSFTR